MVFVSKKKINGKERSYLEQSFRLPDGRVKKVSAYMTASITDRMPYEKKLRSMESTAFQDWAVHYYEKNYIFSDAVIRVCEEMRHHYRVLFKALTDKQRA